MGLTLKQQEHQATLHKSSWAIANNLRGNLEANEFKNYILGLLSYRFLSENVEKWVEILLAEDNMTYQEAWHNKELKEALIEELIINVGYVIEPQYLFSSLMDQIKRKTFDIEQLQKAIVKLSESTIGHESESVFDHLFDDMDLTSNKLGRDVKSRSDLMAKVMTNIANIPFKLDDTDIDILGDTYEYLISQFAANAGKKAGEFYTPQQVSKILAKIVTLGKNDLKSVYDPTCGSGSLLLRVAKEANVRKFYGQELTSSTYNLARMNMLLHNVPYSRFDIKNDDTLEKPQHLDEMFEAIVANPPYSAKWGGDDKFATDVRFSSLAASLPPKSKADFAFILHMLHHLDNDGTMAVVLPHGVLFRGAAEGKIRKYLVEKNYLHAVIGLPANIFFGTAIPTTILVFKKNRMRKDILFIDASNEFESGKNQNIIPDSSVDKIIDTYAKYISIDKYSYVATLDEIIENNFNLNIPRYVDTYEEEEPIDLNAVSQRIALIDKQIAEIDEKLAPFLSQLGL